MFYEVINFMLYKMFGMIYLEEKDYMCVMIYFFKVYVENSFDYGVMF